MVALQRHHRQDVSGPTSIVVDEGKRPRGIGQGAFLMITITITITIITTMMTTKTTSTVIVLVVSRWKTYYAHEVFLN